MELYINKIRADIDDDALLAITYQSTDYTNPTAIKNSYSKTVKLKGTKTNNTLFGEIYHLDRSLIEASGQGTGIYYDPRKKISFELYLNSEIIESGYLKLDSVVNTQGLIEYNCTLYGTLGDFFYNLAYDENGEQRTLADLNFGLKGVEDESKDVIFSLKQNWIIESWQKLKGSKALDGTASDYFTAIPTYSGYYDNFDNDKVLVLRDNSNKNYFPDVTIDNNLYATKQGFVTVEAQREMDEWEARDLRANYQRIGVKLSKVIEAICNPQNNGGYDVSIDTSTIEPYFNNSYIMLDRLNYEDSTIQELDPISGSATILGAQVSQTHQSVHLELTPTIVIPTTDESVTVVTTFPKENDFAHPNRPLYNGQKKPENLNVNGVYIRIQYTNDANEVKNLYYFMTTYINGENDTIIGTEHYKALGLDRSTKMIYGKLAKKGDINNTSYYQFDKPLTLEITDLKKDSSVIMAISDLSYERGTMRNCALKVAERIYKPVTTTTPTRAYPTAIISPDSGMYNSDNAPQLGKVDVTKKVLFANAATPLEFLTSFTKLYDLRYFVDIPKKRIEIIPRNKYYINEVKDLNNRIDRSKGVTTTPTLVEYKNYKYELPSAESYAEKLYAKVSSLGSGGMLYSTPYNFNKETSDVFENNAYKNYIMYRLSSIYFNTVTDNNQIVPSVAYSPTYTYTLYSGNKSTEQKVNGVSAANALNNRFDKIPKISCFDSDNNDVTDIKQALVFFDGFEATDKIIVSDSVQAMNDLNGGLCHLWVNNNQSYATIVNEIPKFSKYLTDDNALGYAYSYDFKKPNITFIDDDNLYGDECTLISEYWNSYLQDVYHKDSKAIEVQCLLPDKPYMALRYFYHFDGALWILAKVTDYNPVNPAPVKCKLIKVFDKYNYLK